MMVIINFMTFIIHFVIPFLFSTKTAAAASKKSSPAKKIASPVKKRTTRARK